MMIEALTSLAKSASKPSKVRNTTLGSSPTTVRSIANRSSGVKSGSFDTLTATATMSWSQRPSCSALL